MNSSSKELLERPIPGINAKVLISVIVLLVGGTLGYADIKNSVSSGKKERIEILELVRGMRDDQKQDKKIDDARMDAIELSVRECKIRMDFMEKFIEGYNKPIK